MSTLVSNDHDTCWHSSFVAIADTIQLMAHCHCGAHSATPYSQQNDSLLRNCNSGLNEASKESTIGPIESVRFHI